MRIRAVGHLLFIVGTAAACTISCGTSTPGSPEATVVASSSARDVPILLSIGYTSCHLCHAMT
ncbi:DUF255 domain-containing protein [Nocardia uniformis]|uniref:DUF255 domain-containing protein n=1 Tax=Nocardia uniformis TaxID=53432 RepID=A0A849C0P4_9NOCA|nr:DUF255 domain-containing protein [Nocardia uniformis]